MLPRFHLKDFTILGHYLGLLTVLLAATMLVPLVVALVFAEYSCAVDFLYSIGICMLVGALLMLLPAGRLDRRRSLLLCGLGWVFIGVMAAIPLHLSGDFDSFIDAIFDAVSALTTTGVSVADNIDCLAYSQITWRATLSLIGAQVIIVMALHLGFFGSGGYSSVENAAARHTSLTSHNLRDTGRYVMFVAGLTVFVGLAVICIVCLLHGFSLGDAIMNGYWLSASAYSTGSFVPHTSSLIFYHSTWLNVFISMLMLLGSLNFSIYALAIRGNRKLMLNNSETRLFVIWITVLVIVVTILQCRDGIFTSLSGLFDHGTFMVIAAATTSGMQTIYPQQIGITFATGPFILIMAAMVVGSSSNSTGGGIKIFRVLRLVHWFSYSIRQALVPDSVHVNVRYNHFGPRVMTPGSAMIAMVITTLYIVAAAVGALAFVAHGYGALESACESISYVTNSGFTTGVTSDGLSIDLELIAMLLMWAGRLEFIALAAMVAGLIASIAPRKNFIPEGVTATRKEQRKQARKKWRKRVAKDWAGFFGGDKGKGGGASPVAVGLVLALSLALVCAPMALAASNGGEVSASDIPETNNTNSIYQEVSVTSLVSATTRLDGEYVKVTGEVMGQITDPGDGSHVWINIKDKQGAMIGVFVPRSQVADLQYFGGYEQTGDTVEINGVFNISCSEHSGELDVHASSLNITAQGAISSTPASNGRLVFALIFIALAFIIILLRTLFQDDHHRRRATMAFSLNSRRKKR